MLTQQSDDQLVRIKFSFSHRTFDMTNIMRISKIVYFGSFEFVALKKTITKGMLNSENILVWPTENFQIKWNVLICSPKFLT